MNTDITPIPFPTIRIGPNRRSTIQEVFGILLCGVLFMVMLWALFNDHSATALQVGIMFIPLAGFLVLFMMVAILSFRTVRRIEVNPDSITLIRWMNSRTRIQQDSIKGFSACAWRYSSEWWSSQGIVLYTVEGSHEIMDHSIGDLQGLVDLLNASGVPYIGEELVWYPYLSKRHRFDSQ